MEGTHRTGREKRFLRNSQGGICFYLAWLPQKVRLQKTKRREGGQQEQVIGVGGEEKALNAHLAIGKV